MGIIEPSQSRAARGLLNWTQAELAAASRLSLPTVRRFENGAHLPMPDSLTAIRGALEDAGIEFYFDEKQNGEVGVILNSAQPKNALKKRKALEKYILLHGRIVRSCSANEFLLHDLCLKCLKLKPYKTLTPGRSNKLDENIKIVSALVSRPGPLVEYGPPMQQLLDELARFQDLRNFIVHGLSEVVFTSQGAAHVHYQRHRDREKGVGVSKFKLGLEQLQASAEHLEKISKDMKHLASKIIRDQSLDSNSSFKHSS